MIQRYRIAFLLSSLVFISLWAIYLNLPEVEKKIKEIEKKVIRISLLAPAIPKKTIEKKVEEKKPVVIPQPIIPKIKPKKIVKKIIKRPKPKAKKIIKKVVIKPKAKAKPKPKPKPKPKKIVKKVIKKPKPKKVIKKVKPIQPEVYYEPQPIIKAEPIMQREVYIPPPKVVHVPQPKIQIPKPIVNTNNGQAKKAFLRNVRSKIISNKKYPKMAKRRHIEGSVKVRFDITATGQVTNIRFINGKRVFYKSIRNSLEKTFPMGIPDNVRSELPIPDVSVTLHFNIR